MKYIYIYIETIGRSHENHQEAKSPDLGHAREFYGRVNLF